MRPPTLRKRIHEQLDPRAKTNGLSAINKVLTALILVAAALAIAETETSLSVAWRRLFGILELSLGVVFAAEYAVRIWIAPERKPDSSPWLQRFRFVVSPAGLTDLAAVLASLLLVAGSSALLLRLVRLFRLLRLAKLGRFSRAWDHIASAVSDRREELLISLAAGLVLMLSAATALYLVEGGAQPDKFGSIPRSLWWSVATMTTIGYGDVYPVTTLGKVLASVAAIVSIGFIAMPTGILAAAFSDAMQRSRRASRT